MGFNESDCAIGKVLESTIERYYLFGWRQKYDD